MPLAGGRGKPGRSFGGWCEREWGVAIYTAREVDSQVTGLALAAAEASCNGDPFLHAGRGGS
eukprot:2610419-Pyramimonas_sp.AAC.1